MKLNRGRSIEIKISVVLYRYICFNRDISIQKRDRAFYSANEISQFQKVSFQFQDLYTELDLHRLWVVSMEHLQRVWHASRERLPFRTPGSVPHCGTCLCSKLLRPDSANLPFLYSTFHLEYPLRFSRFCLAIDTSFYWK